MLQQSHLLRNQPECRKRRLFRFFHSTLEHYSFHPNLYNILLVLQILQIADYGLHESYGPLWNAPASNGIRTALSYMDLSPIWLQGSGVALLFFVIIWVIVNAATLGLTIYQVEKDPRKLEKPNIFVIKLVTLYSVFLKSILLVPLAYSFSAFANPISFGVSAKQQIVLAVFSVLGFGLTLANLSLYIYFMRDNSPFSKLPFACSVNSQEQLRSGFKLALGIYGSFAQSSFLVGEIFCAFYIICLIFLCYYNYSRAGYVQEHIGRMLELGLISGLWLGVCSFIQMQVSTQAALGFSLCVLGLIMVPLAWRSVQSKRRKQLLTSNYKMLHSSTSCLLYNYQCIRLANNIQDMQSLQYLQGILNFHIMHCKKSQELCVCLHVRTELLQFNLDKDKEELQKQRKLWFQFIRSNLTEVRQKYQKVTEIRFLLAYIQNDILMNKFRALHSLEQAREIQSGYKYQFLDYHYMKEVEKKIEAEDRANNQKKPVDINKYYNFQIGFGRLQELMEESTYQYVSFWELLRSDKVTREKLFDEGARINRKSDEVKDCFERLTAINPSNIHSLVLYSNFMKVIVNNNQPYERNLETIEAVKRTMAQSSKLHREVEKQKYGDNSISAVIIISGERSNIGIIKHCNWKIGEIIGYAPHQLLGQNINILMPKFIGNMHDDVLRNYLELSQSQYDFAERLVPMIDAHNFMVLSRMLTKPLPSLYNGLELVGIFNAVVENNINHPGESPKYVLYRSDTGQVQALSETCFDEFQYKINKIDEFNETSSELTFSTLFVGAKENDILESPGFKCKVLSKIANTSEIEEVAVQVFQRLQIYYYSVRLRLLSFYTLRSYRQMEDTIKNAQETHPDQIIANQNQWQKQPKTERSVIAPERAVKQKFLHEMSKKKGLVNSQATAFKALRAIGYVFFLMATVYSIILIVLHTTTSTINDYLMLTQLSGESLGDLAETAYYARMMHLSHYFPAVNSYAQLQGNISVSVNSLQNSQFSIEKLYLNYGTDFVWVSQWSLSTNGVVSSVQATIDANIFDLVTSASSFNQDPQSTLNFPLAMIKGSSNVTTQLQQLFSIRYSSLFQSIPKKQDYDENFASLFNKFVSSQINYGLLQLGLAVGFLLLFLAVIVALSISLLKTIDQTMLLFGFMSRHQVQREIQNCNSFLEIFYQDSYLIWLKKKQKLKSQAVLNPFVVDELHLRKSQRGGGTSKVLQNNASEGELTLKESPTQQNLVKASLNKIQFLEKELHLRTEAQILISQTQQENQNQLLRGQVDSSEEDAIYDHLSKDQDSRKAQQVLIYLVLVCILTGYFVFEFLLYRSHLTAMQKEIKNVRLAYSNINSLKLVRLYSLQALIDNSQFKTYPLPSVYAKLSYNSLYAAQREFDAVAMADIPNYSIYFLNNCNPTSLAQLQTSTKLFPSGSFSVAECKNVLQAVLVEGLRLAIVGYTESWFNLTRLSNISQVIGTSSFLQARQIQKYIEAPLKIFAMDHYSKVSEIASQKLQSLLLLLLLFFLVLIVLWILIWRNNLMSLNDRLRQTRLILGFIPVRVFIRNAKLTKEYEKYIGDLMQ